jgi:predicted nuclease with TOPRIM domain
LAAPSQSLDVLSGISLSLSECWNARAQLVAFAQELQGKLAAVEAERDALKEELAKLKPPAEKGERLVEKLKDKLHG